MSETINDENQQELSSETEAAEEAKPEEEESPNQSVEPVEAEKTGKEEKTEKKSGKLIAKKILNYVEWVLLLASFGVVIYAFTCTAKGKAVNFFGNSLLHVVTGSMEPTIETGEFVFTRVAEKQDLAVGDIVAYYSEDPEIAGKLVIHRIKEINEDGTYVTMGDANPVPDRLPVRYEQILGRMSGRAHVFNWISSFADPRKLLLMLVVVPIFFLSIYEAGTLGKLIKGAKLENPLVKKKEKEARDAAVEEIRKKAIEEYLKKAEADGGMTEESTEKSEELVSDGSESTETENDSVSEEKTETEEIKENEESKEIEENEEIEEDGEREEGKEGENSQG